VVAEPSFTKERLAVLSEIEVRHFWFAGRRALVERLLGRHARADQRVLDLGCGSGRSVEELGRRGFAVVGLDQRCEGLFLARGANRWLVQAEAARLPFRSGTFDGAVLLDVLEHVDDRAVLAELRRLLKPEGWALLTVPALPWLYSYRDSAAGHRRRYTRRGLGAALTEARLELREARYYQCLLLPLVAATRLLGRRGPALRDLEDRPHPLVNRLLGWISRAEVALGDVVSWPVGSSLAAVCRKG